jgi:hypothetical protein
VHIWALPPGAPASCRRVCGDKRGPELANATPRRQDAGAPGGTGRIRPPWPARSSRPGRCPESNKATGKQRWRRRQQTRAPESPPASAQAPSSAFLAVYKGCTPDARGLHNRPKREHPVSTPCTRRWNGPGRAQNDADARGVRLPQRCTREAFPRTRRACGVITYRPQFSFGSCNFVAGPRAAPR